jgi:MFS family permease
MTARASPNNDRTIYLVVTAAAILLITMGARQSLGLFVRPLSAATGLGIVAISFALAIGQFVWGLAQPVFGAVSDRFGFGAVLRVGAVMLAAGAVLTTMVSSELGLTLAVGVLFAAGAGAGSFSTLIGVTARSLAPEKRAFASGVINAGGSLGQFLLAPLSQLIIGTAGWVIAMWTLAIAALLTLPLAQVLLRSSRAAANAQPQGAVSAGQNPQSLREQLEIASGNRSYWCLHLGFFTCGFHMRFWSRTCPVR